MTRRWRPRFPRVGRWGQRTPTRTSHLEDPTLRQDFLGCLLKADFDGFTIFIIVFVFKIVFGQLTAGRTFILHVVGGAARRSSGSAFVVLRSRAFSIGLVSAIAKCVCDNDSNSFRWILLDGFRHGLIELFGKGNKVGYYWGG
jgi:hypothetical protein